MTEEEKARVHRICYASKRGQYVSPEDARFCERMFHTDPDGYGVVQKQASDESVGDWLAGMGVRR